MLVQRHPSAALLVKQKRSPDRVLGIFVPTFSAVTRRSTMGAFKAFSLVGLLIFGTLSSIFSKIVYQTEGRDFDGHIKSFRKPW